MPDEATQLQLYKLEARIDAVQSLVLAVAQTMPKQEFREQAKQRLESTRTTYLFSKHPEAETCIKEIDLIEKWIDTLTS